MGKTNGVQNLEFIRTTEAEIIRLERETYLESIPFAQEYYLEIQIKTADFYRIMSAGKPAGYFILSAEKTLLEYFVRPEWENQIDEIFGRILREFAVTNALCKSFDAPLLSCCYSYQIKSRAVGILFRDYLEKNISPERSEVTIRRATLEDEAYIIEVNEEVFDHPEEVKEYILAKQIFLYEIDGNLAGFGIYSPVFPGRTEYDIGMLVVPMYRHQGYGTFIIHHLVNFCRQNGWIFSAGCDIKNTGSRRCLENAGFIARYRLLDFSF